MTSARTTLPLLVGVASLGAALSPLAAEAKPKNESTEAAEAESMGHDHGHGPARPHRAEAAPVVDIELDPRAGSEVGLVYESYLSPQQEADEETDVPGAAPAVFKSTKPSTPREERPGRGHGVLAFTKDFSRATVQLALTDIDPDEIVMAHIHCGKPGMLGPIIVDFGKTGDLTEYFADGELIYEVTNQDLEWVIEDSKGIVGAFTGGCPINKLLRPGDRVRTIAGMAVIAEEGELYFNIHTRSQTFYGDVRGQLLPQRPWDEVVDGDDD